MRAILAVLALGLGMLLLAGFGGSAAGLDEVRGGLPGGSYACVFSVDGTKAATKRFRVSR